MLSLNYLHGLSHFRKTFRLVDSDNEISKTKLSNVQEGSELKKPATPVETKHLSDLDSESAVDDIEIIEKPERTDIEKKLE